MRNLSIFVLVSIFVFLASSCQRVQIVPSTNTSTVSEISGNRTTNLSAPNNFRASNISERNITFKWDAIEGDEGYILDIYTNEGVLLNSYHIAANVNEYTGNWGEGSFKAVIRRDCGEGFFSASAETAATACCGTYTDIEDIIERMINNDGGSACSSYDIESYTMSAGQNGSIFSHATYNDSDDYLVVYGLVNSPNAVPTHYYMIPMSNILTVNAANSSMKHTLQLDFQTYSYSKIYFIPWDLVNCSVD